MTPHFCLPPAADHPPTEGIPTLQRGKLHLTQTRITRAERTTYRHVPSPPPYSRLCFYFVPSQYPLFTSTPLLPDITSTPLFTLYPYIHQSLQYTSHLPILTPRISPFLSSYLILFHPPLSTHPIPFSDASASLLLRIKVPKSEERTNKERRRNEQSAVWKK